MTLSVKPNFRVCGKMFGKNINEYSKALEKLSQQDITKLQNNENITIKFNEEDLEVTSEMVEIRVSSKEGYDAAFLNDNFIVIDTILTDSLIREGIARELVSKVQNIRKESGLDISDRITLYYSGDISDVISEFESYIKDEVLALSIEENNSLDKEYDLNGKLVKLDVKKA
jgi:isoleucyl-tRNA synthetase